MRKLTAYQYRSMSFEQREAVRRANQLEARRAAARLSFDVHTDHAYTPRETANYGGGRHLICEEPLEQGRLRRAAGDALCKPVAKFWGLGGSPQGALVDPATCHRCVEIADRLGQADPLPQTEHARRALRHVAETFSAVGGTFNGSVLELPIGSNELVVELEMDEFFDGMTTQPALILSEIEVLEKGRGIGSRAVEALRVYSDASAVPLVVAPIVNLGFWERFAWLAGVGQPGTAIRSFATSHRRPTSRARLALAASARGLRG